ncbi:hypothetical protein Pelo_3377 [Pelomyxa schiedti]|nr:hypothetical protein Pelo_3377 [Pelomyxa schiedti]
MACVLVSECVLLPRVNLAILLDVGSHVQSGFNLICLALYELHSFVSSKAHETNFTIIEYDTAVRIACPFTNDAQKLFDVVQQPVQWAVCPHNTPNLEDALRLGASQLGSISHPNDLQVVLVVTSGQLPLVRTIPYLMAKLVIMAAAVGSTTVKQLEVALPGAMCFMLDNHQSLLRSLSDLKQLARKAGHPPAEVLFSQLPCALQRFTDPVSLAVTIRPHSVLGTVPTGTVLHFLPGFYLDEVVKTTSDATMACPFQTTVTLTPCSRAVVLRELVPAKVHYECLVGGAKLLGSVTLLLACFAAEWIPERTFLPDPSRTKLNILVWGCYGRALAAPGVLNAGACHLRLHRPHIA